jgi:DNA polymerase III subunit beta
MKASISQQQLSHGLSMVSRAVSPRSTLPVLANVLVATDEGRLRLSTTNLEMGITAWITAKVEEEGAITVPARTFADLVNTLPNDTVYINLNTKNQTLNVRCGTSTTDIKGIDAQEFPPIPIPDLREGIELKISDFKEMVQQVAFSASSDEARPVLQGVMTVIKEDQITLAATDGFRIAVRKADLPGSTPNSMTAIIPARALIELARIAADGSQTLTMVVQPGRGQVLFHLKDAELSSLLIEGNFPDYNVIIPRSFKTSTVLSTSAFHKACKQAEIIARDGNNVVRVNILPGSDKPGKVELSAQSEETGSSEIEVDATIDGAGLVIAFNVAFLREVLDVIKTPSIALETNANNTPAMIRPIGEENYLHVIMPMHLG